MSLFEQFDAVDREFGEIDSDNFNDDHIRVTVNNNEDKEFPEETVVEPIEGHGGHITESDSEESSDSDYSDDSSETEDNQEGQNKDSPGHASVTESVITLKINQRILRS